MKSRVYSEKLAQVARIIRRIPSGIRAPIGRTSPPSLSLSVKSIVPIIADPIVRSNERTAHAPDSSIYIYMSIYTHVHRLCWPARVAKLKGSYLYCRIPRIFESKKRPRAANEDIPTRERSRAHIRDFDRRHLYIRESISKRLALALYVYIYICIVFSAFCVFRTHTTIFERRESISKNFSSRRYHRDHVEPAAASTWLIGLKLNFRAEIAPTLILWYI